MSTLKGIFPTDIGTIHFIGIGGIGMSGIAEILHNLGYKVQGSDPGQSYVTEHLEDLGIKVFNKQEGQNIDGCSLVVKSTAIKDDNPEVVRALELNIPIIRRSEMLAEIMRFKNSISISGTHGKTTTTSLVACMLEAAKLDPTVINGGIINNKKTNAYLGEGQYLVAEADESDGTFIKVPSYIGAITNIDPEHLDYYQTFENAIAAYRTFIMNLPFYGFGVLCYDHPIVRQLGTSIKERRIISYGLNSPSVDLHAVNIRTTEFGSVFDVQLSESYQKRRKIKQIKDINLHLHGKHNVSNSLVAIAVALELGISVEIIQQAFTSFGGVKRRFTKVGEVGGYIIIDDYAHHPVEIVATLNTARDVANTRGGRVIAVMQPHRYTRLRDLMDDFSQSMTQADEIIIADVYPAGEKPIPGIDSAELVRRIKLHTKRKALLLKDNQDLPKIISELARPKDLVILLGAGNISNWAYELQHKIEILHKNVA